MNDTIALGHKFTTKKGDSSRSVEQKSAKGKPTCNYYGKLGHIANISISKIGNQGHKQNIKGQCHKCKKQGHQAHECRSKNISTYQFNSYCYNYLKYGHRAYECRSKPNKSPKQGNTYDWDYNTRFSCHYS